MSIAKYFEALRNDPAHHLGMGDVRLTMAMQDEVAAMAASHLGKMGAGVPKGYSRAEIRRRTAILQKHNAERKKAVGGGGAKATKRSGARSHTEKAH